MCICRSRVGDIPSARCCCSVLCLLDGKTIGRSLLQEQDQVGLVLVVCEVGGPLLLALSEEALFQYWERSWQGGRRLKNETKETSHKILCARQQEKYL
jgi:hypothetical protein